MDTGLPILHPFHVFSAAHLRPTEKVEVPSRQSSDLGFMRHQRKAKSGLCKVGTLKSGITLEIELIEHASVLGVQPLEL